MFTPTVGTIVTALMVIACIGSLLGWQFTVAQVFKSSADVGYFLPVFARATRTGTPIVGMVILLVAQVALALMLGGLCVFLGWTLFGFVSARFYQMEVDAHVKEPGKSLQA
ncbi:hypothetical protein WJ23_26980 [Burkholderia lata]|uniref:hypothetical protein n=1 Tax=Burkholderia lata (strain ATCC 17760 / DSM 23089 / LMG 22485 / NCIMB 9086 / R18194 / 383) TaxID=482957 RepID=UPI0008417DEE|nr:hypothetical protein [Burkholderia lata]AOJ41589.1 hypothetical protein WJ23_26980 [Burkholderia lata]